MIDSTRWIILDNLRNHWHYWCNLNKDIADKNYLWLVNNEYIKDGMLTPKGQVQLLLSIDRVDRNS